ncbi:MAG: periplasmic copper chaperone [Bradyrhizobium sp.]|jgi:copper(I)-binding protein|nr:periplasmic copper chaperone [Bradyrhizobium sp.]
MILKACLIAAALALAAPSAFAHDYKAGAIEIDHPWARATPRGATVAAGYFKLTNTGSTPDRLVGGTSEAAGRVEIHEMTMADGVMRMRPLKDGIELKPGASVELKSSSFHLMMVGLKQQLQQGQRIKGTLTFEKAGPVDIEYVVEGIGGAPSAAPADSKMHMNMH